MESSSDGTGWKISMEKMLEKWISPQSKIPSEFVLAMLFDVLPLLGYVGVDVTFFCFDEKFVSRIVEIISVESKRWKVRSGIDLEKLLLNGRKTNRNRRKKKITVVESELKEIIMNNDEKDRSENGEDVMKRILVDMKPNGLRKKCNWKMMKPFCKTLFRNAYLLILKKYYGNIEKSIECLLFRTVDRDVIRFLSFVFHFCKNLFSLFPGNKELAEVVVQLVYFENTKSAVNDQSALKVVIFESLLGLKDHEKMFNRLRQIYSNLVEEEIKSKERKKELSEVYVRVVGLEKNVKVLKREKQKKEKGVDKKILKLNKKMIKIGEEFFPRLKFLLREKVENLIKTRNLQVISFDWLIMCEIILLGKKYEVSELKKRWKFFRSLKMENRMLNTIDCSGKYVEKDSTKVQIAPPQIKDFVPCFVPYMRPLPKPPPLLPSFHAEKRKNGTNFSFDNSRSKKRRKMNGIKNDNTRHTFITPMNHIDQIDKNDEKPLLICGENCEEFQAVFWCKHTEKLYENLLENFH